MSQNYRVFTDDAGEVLVKTNDGAIHASVKDAEAYLNDHQLEILVEAFMADVEKDLPAYLGNKEGKLPESDRAVLALKTRLRNNTALAFAWKLAHDRAA